MTLRHTHSTPRSHLVVPRNEKADLPLGGMDVTVRSDSAFSGDESTAFEYVAIRPPLTRGLAFAGMWGPGGALSEHKFPMHSMFREACHLFVKRILDLAIAACLRSGPELSFANYARECPQYW